MEKPDYSVWNPLDFLLPLDEEVDLNLEEMSSMGSRVAEIAHEQSVSLTYSGSAVVGREVGDDRVDLSRSVDPLCAMLMVQEEVVMMVTSPEDTSIRKRSWNFCEVTSGPPTDPYMGYDHLRKGGDFTELGFNDSIILRIILDVQKGDGEEHSSTQPGKMGMLGSRLATPRRENRGYWMIASALQDAMLCTHRASEPKYLPPVMGGTGVTALFDNSNNVFLYVLAYKGGTYRRIYATACSEMREYLFSLERGVQSAPILCPRLREKQEYFWGTYDHMVFVPKPLDIGNAEEPPKPLYVATGGQNRYLAFENRLLRTRHLVTRRQAQVEFMHTQRLTHIFQSLFPTMKVFADLDKEENQRKRARYNGALTANAALQNLLKREASRSDAIKMMGSEAFHTVTTGRRDFTREDAVWVYANGQGENYSLRDVTLSEDMFLREEVSVEETFKVSGIPLKPYFSGGERIRPTKISVGLYQINETMEEWADNLCSRLKDARDTHGRPLTSLEVIPIFNERREWVNDDTGLVAQCMQDTLGTKARYRVVLVSNDKRLANQMAEQANVQVIRVSPREFVRITTLAGERISDSSSTAPLINSMKPKPDYVYVDTGSVMAAASQMTMEDGKFFIRTLLSTGWEGESRFSRVTLTESQRTRIVKQVHNPVQRPRTWRTGSRPYESVYSSPASAPPTKSSGSTWWRSGKPLPPISGSTNTVVHSNHTVD